MSEYSEYSSEEELEEISDIDDDDDSSERRERKRQVHQQRRADVDPGQQEIPESSESPSSQDDNNKLTDLIKTQQMIIDSLRKELASIKFQITLPTSGHRKCAPKSEESTSAVVSSFEDDDDDLDSLSSEDSAAAERYDQCLAERGAPLMTNPLFVDVIVQKVMEHLPLKSLLLARIVCHKWNEMATHQLTCKCGPVQLEVHQPWRPSKGIKVSTFIDVMRNSLACPFSKYSISSFNALEELDRFFFHFGRSVKHLDLNFSEEFEDSQELVVLLTRKLPNLESLRIGCCQMFKNASLWKQSDDNWSKTGGKAGVSSLRSLKTFCIGNIINIIPSKPLLESLFRMTPKLEKLVLHVNFKENGNTFIRIVLEAIMMIPEVMKNIQSLMISCLTESHLRTLIKLAESGLRLKHFRFQDLCLHLTEINGATLETFLSSQADHLQTLEIEQSSNFPRIRHFQLPVMKMLKTFSLSSSQRISFGTLTYSVHLPKLEKLILRGFDVFNCGSIFPHSQNENVQRTRALNFNGHSLRVLSLPSKLSIPHFPQVLSRIFPNVTDLEVRGVTNESLREIWEHWPKLEKFKLVVSHFDDNIDSGMTGIQEDVCRELRSEGQLDSGQLEEYKTGPAITDLKCLRSLELECRAMWIPCQLVTDITGYFALVHLTNLQKLKVTEIGVPEKFDLSNECINEIINTLKIDDATFKIMDDHGRWQLELGRIDLLRNTYESEPQLEDHNKDKIYIID